VTSPPPTSPPPSLTERRKAVTQLEIARAAAELFTEHGPDGTTAEDIARRAGVALRTFYRYFRSKQDAVAPLFMGGGAQWRERLAELSADHDLATALERSVAESFATEAPEAAESMLWARGLLRAGADDPALRTVWYRVNQEAEEQLTPLLARLAGPDADPLEVRLAAAAVIAALRIAVETWAASDGPLEGAGAPADLAVRCVRELSGLRLLEGGGGAAETGSAKPRPAPPSRAKSPRSTAR
jgi:AcrR family transcriptional regulator